MIAVGVVALGCALIGIYQYFARNLFLNPELFDANELHVYFRVNSIFFDPNVFGRYLALAITALGACMAWGSSRRDLAAAGIVCAVALVALVFSYSITSFAALLAGLGIVAILRWRWRGSSPTGRSGLAGARGPRRRRRHAHQRYRGRPQHRRRPRGPDQGRAGPVRRHDDSDARDQGDIGKPIAGYGSGAFGRAFFDHIEQARTTVSHSEPVTVAAEQGVIGLAVYVALLGLRPRDPAGRPGRSLMRIAAAACFVAILVDSFGYTGS